jgi:hypothetical protein
MIFEGRNDLRYFFTMHYQKPEARGDSHEPYVVLNRWRTLLCTLEALDFCKQCEQEVSHEPLLVGLSLDSELKHLYHEVDQLFARINAFAEKAVAYFDHYVPLCEHCQIAFRVGVTAAQAMQDSIFENPETPDTIWFENSRCLEELFHAQGRENDPSRSHRTVPQSEQSQGEPLTLSAPSESLSGRS